MARNEAIRFLNTRILLLIKQIASKHLHTQSQADFFAMTNFLPQLALHREHRNTGSIISNVFLRNIIFTKIKSGGKKRITGVGNGTKNIESNIRCTKSKNNA
jgi:hypothetical protein